MTKVTIYNVQRAVTQKKGTPVMVLVFCKSSYGDKHFYSFVKNISSYEADMIL